MRGLSFERLILTGYLRNCTPGVGSCVSWSRKDWYACAHFIPGYCKVRIIRKVSLLSGVCNGIGLRKLAGIETKKKKKKSKACTPFLNLRIHARQNSGCKTGRVITVVISSLGFSRLADSAPHPRSSRRFASGGVVMSRCRAARVSQLPWARLRALISAVETRSGSPRSLRWARFA